MFQIGNKNLYIVGNVGVSYNTPIAADFKSLEVTFITSSYYSNTTAHHKTELVRIFNNKEVIEVSQALLVDIINGEVPAKEVLKDFQHFQTCKDIISGNVSGSKSFILSDNCHQISSENKYYKNGNYKIVTIKELRSEYFTAKFKVVNHYFKQVSSCRNSRTQQKGISYNIKTRIYWSD